MILLDTHVWVWWLNDSRVLSAGAMDAIQKAKEAEPILISSISVWEIANLVARGRLVLTMGVREWVAKSEALPFFRFVPVNNTIAIRAVDLPGDFHQDPADRIIVATALSMGARVVTKDDKIIEYPHVRTVW
jgi:PIN domain nuclease of toxin-antitoxin system